MLTCSKSTPNSGIKISILLNASRIASGPKRHPGLYEWVESKGIPNNLATGSESSEGDIIFGDQYVSLKVMLPEKIDDKLIEFIESWAKNNDYNPRKKLKIN